MGDLRLGVRHECAGVTGGRGPNGWGKRTLLRAIVGAGRPSSGHILLRGRALFDERGVELPPEVGHLHPRGLARNATEHHHRALATVDHGFAATVPVLGGDDGIGIVHAPGIT